MRRRWGGTVGRTWDSRPDWVSRVPRVSSVVSSRATGSSYGQLTGPGSSPPTLVNPVPLEPLSGPDDRGVYWWIDRGYSSGRSWTKTRRYAKTREKAVRPSTSTALQNMGQH